MDRNEVAEYLASLTEDEYRELSQDARPELGKGRVVAGVGQQPVPVPSDPQSQIAVAERAGDWAKANVLKAQQLTKMLNDR